MTQSLPAAVLADAAAAVRAYLRMADDAEPAVLALAVRAAFDAAEAFCGRALVARTPDEPLPQGWAALPGAIAQGVVLAAAALIERGADAPAPLAATALWRPLRIARLLPQPQASGGAEPAA